MKVKMYPSCQLCYEKYDAVLRKPLIFLCGHSVCESCRITILKLAPEISDCSCDVKTKEKSCQSCHGTSCPVCRFPRALQIDVCDVHLLENVANISAMFAELKSANLKTSAEVNTTVSAIQICQEQYNNSIKKYESETLKLEQLKEHLLMLNLQDGTERIYNCKDCQGGPFPSTRMHACLYCSSNHHLSKDSGIHIVTDMKGIEKNLLCDFCSLVKVNRTCPQGHKRTICLRELELLTDMEYAINKFMVQYNKLDLDTCHPELIKFRQLFQHSLCDTDRQALLVKLEEFIKNPRRVSQSLTELDITTISFSNLRT